MKIIKFSTVCDINSWKEKIQQKKPTYGLTWEEEDRRGRD